MKNGKDVGSDRIPVEIWNSLGEEELRRLQSFLISFTAKNSIFFYGKGRLKKRPSHRPADMLTERRKK